MKPTRSSQLFIALDTPDLPEALRLARAVKPFVHGLKIGLEFLTANGPDGARRIVELGLPVFADTKFHDIPNTVAGASRAIASLGVAMFNIHASGGAAMIAASREAARGVNPDIKLLAVTVLTSMNGADLDAVGQRGPLGEQVARLAGLAHREGVDGVVCGASEIGAVRAACGEKFLIVVPGIRPEGSANADQRRTMTPGEAARAGADVLVVGRPITAARDPGEAAHAIARELEHAIAA